MKLIRFGNLIINAAQIVDAVFTPATESRAKLDVTFTAPESEPRYDHDGNYIGEETSLYNRILRGEEAELLWAKLCKETTQ